MRTESEETTNGILPGSYRDPSGFVFRRDGTLYRQVNHYYAAEYDRLLSSGLYDALTRAGSLIPHEEVDSRPEEPALAYKIIAPEQIPFVSYPYEWCFSQLKDAALLTLEIQRTALRHGMTLKDGSAYNIQFHRGKPLFIDTLSFESYQEGQAWTPYRQFCEHFLAPLGLMALRDIRLGQLLYPFFDGLPLDFASALLPLRTRLMFPWQMHIHTHARFQQRYASTPMRQPAGGQQHLSTAGLLGLLDSLEGAIRKLSWTPKGTEWAAYYTDTNYSETGFRQKQQLIGAYLTEANPRMVWDLGANNGVFSRLASDRGIFTVAWDIDPAAVEQNYRQCRQRGQEHLLPLLLDLINPSPGIGWENRERTAFLQRGPVDTVFALALIHHLCISHSVPLGKLASLLRRLCRSLVIEFVPKHDSQVQRLLASRKDIFSDYTQEAFEHEFRRYFTIRQQHAIQDSTRTLYLMESR